MAQKRNIIPDEQPETDTPIVNAVYVQSNPDGSLHGSTTSPTAGIFSEPEPTNVDATQLTALFAPEDLEFRALRWNRERTSAIPFAYLTSRAAMERLDQVFGYDGWDMSTKFQEPKEGHVVCVITLTIKGRGWATRTGTGESEFLYDSNNRLVNEPWKGAETDAFRRAAMGLGIARYLYKAPTVWLDWDDKKRKFLRNPAEVLFNPDGSFSAEAIAKSTVKYDPFDEGAPKTSAPQPTPRVEKPAAAPATKAPAKNAGNNVRNAPSQALITWAGDVGYDIDDPSTADSVAGEVRSIITDGFGNKMSMSMAQIKTVGSLVDQLGISLPEDFATMGIGEGIKLIGKLMAQVKAGG